MRLELTADEIYAAERLLKAKTPPRFGDEKAIRAANIMSRVHHVMCWKCGGEGRAKYGLTQRIERCRTCGGFGSFYKFGQRHFLKPKAKR